MRISKVIRTVSHLLFTITVSAQEVNKGNADVLNTTHNRKRIIPIAKN